MPHKSLIEITCSTLKIKEEDLFSKSRKGVLVFGRRMICNMLFKNFNNYGVRELGKIFNRDHSTISSYFSTHQGDYDTNYDEYRDYFDKIWGAFNKKDSPGGKYFDKISYLEKIRSIEEKLKGAIEELSKIKQGIHEE